MSGGLPTQRDCGCSKEIAGLVDIEMMPHRQLSFLGGDSCSPIKYVLLVAKNEVPSDPSFGTTRIASATRRSVIFCLRRTRPIVAVRVGVEPYEAVEKS
jgi:hypothetical protein